MTECERIIKEGVLSESFFLPETICDFYVDERRKKIWAIVLDILIQFDSICRRHNLKYFMAFGALLGAIRHKGYIPWDDDLDVCMPRKDYERFVKYARTELKEPYFLQIPGEDYGYYFAFTKIRNSNTTCISESFRYERFNQGIALDIFVLDNFKEDDLAGYFNKLNNLILENSANMRRSNPHPSVADIERMNSYVKRNPQTVFDEIEEMSTKYNTEICEMCIVSGLTVYKPQKILFKWSDVADLVDCDFYGYKFLIPADYDSVLKTTYGDYMKYPPLEQRGVWHNSVIFNPDKSYKDSLKELLNNEKA